MSSTLTLPLRDLENFSKDFFLAIDDLTLGYEFEFNPSTLPPLDLDFFLEIHDLTPGFEFEFNPCTLLPWDLKNFQFFFGYS